MTLTPDKIELAQQIADVLEERINALSPKFFGSTYTKTDCCKHLIKPLPGEYQIDTVLESLPPHVAKSPRETYSKLMFCFNDAGELINQELPLNTIVRYVKDLIQELRNTGQGGKQNIVAKKEKTMRPGPRIKHTDEKMKQVMISFDKFKAESIDTKQAWNKVAEYHDFKSGNAASQAYYRYRQKRNK